MSQKKIKTSFLILIMICFFVLTSFVFCGCNQSPQKNNVLKSSVDAFGFAGATSLGILNGMQTNQPLGVMQVQSSNAPELDRIAIIDELHQYMQAVYGVVGKNAITSKKEVLENDKDGYEYKIITTIVNLKGEKQVIELKFKETQIIEEDEEDEEDNEIEKKLQGEMIFEGQKYSISGVSESEEDELGIEFTAYLDENKDNYIVVEQEFENDEQSFHYTVFKSGVLQEDFSIELEEDDGELELEIESAKTTLGKHFSYKAEREGNKIKLTVYHNKSKIETIKGSINESGDTITYEFQDGFILERAF